MAGCTTPFPPGRLLQHKPRRTPEQVPALLQDKTCMVRHRRTRKVIDENCTLLYNSYKLALGKKKG